VLGSATPTDFHNVLVVQVEDPERFVEQLALWVEREPGLLNTIAHVFVAQVSFFFDDEDAFEAEARHALVERLDELVGKSFHLRVHRRGFKGRHSSHELERRFGAFLLETLEAADQCGRIDFADPDVVVIIETVGRRAGVWFCQRQDRRRMPFLRSH
jgi:tRNA(Ser,Leu) C12 N-acetylase TAN1